MFVICWGLLAVLASLPGREAGLTIPIPPPSVWGQFQHGTVAADSKYCSQVGTYFLKRHDASTIDATIATLLCMCVIHPHSCGLGGGFLATIYDSNKKQAFSLNAREVAPAAATENMFVADPGKSTLGGLATGVPGEIAGYGALHKLYGKMKWKDLFAPAIRLCENGFEVDQALHRALGPKESVIRSQPGLSEIFIKPNGDLAVQGDILKRPKLAKTLTRIAKNGWKSFYNGYLAKTIVKEIQAAGGIITRTDLRRYAVRWKKPVSVTLKNGGYTLYGPPPPSSSLVTNYILNILDEFDVSPSDITTEGAESLLAHRMVEASKFGFGKRAYLGDEDCVDITSWKWQLQSDLLARFTKCKMSDAGALPFDEYESYFSQPNATGTAQLSVSGPDGISISVTTTVNTHLASKIRGQTSGIIFNNQMDDFSTPGTSNFFGVPASPANFVRPGCRPMSSMSPTIVTKDGKFVAAVGASGGTRIISAIVRTLLNNLWLGASAQNSVDWYRFHHQLLPATITHEGFWPQYVADALQLKDPSVTLATRGPPADAREFSVVQFIRSYCATSQDPKCLHAVSDGRRGGEPDGF